MENRKSIKIFCTIVFGFLFLSMRGVFAYGIDTHAFLTKNAIEFYSEKVATSSVSNLQDYLIDGARKEDDIPRWMNHFYDPMNNRGLTDSILGNWPKSKDWAINSDMQNEMKYKVPTTVASILTAIQQRNINTLTTKTDFTWNEALYFWINGEKEKAMFALGHILHLIQDASVPDHTRNDPHPGNSPYENYTSKFTLDNQDKELSQKLSNKNIITLHNLDSYFDEVAKYSNNNFYSKDTIGIQGGYDLPEFGDQELFKNKYYLIQGKDLEGNKYYLAKQTNISSFMVGFNDNFIIDDDISPSYWSLLSPKAVQYSASVINFFFKEAERLKDDPQFAKKESFFAQVIDVAKDIVSAVTDTVQNIVGVVKDNARIAGQNLLASVSLDENNNTVQSSEQKTIGPNLVVQPIQNNDVVAVAINPPFYKPDKSYETNKSDVKKPMAGEIGVSLKQNSEQEINENTSSSTQNQPSNKLSETSNVQNQNIQPLLVAPQVCSFQTSKMPTHQKLLINEVAWMGSIKSANDEWIEFKNISGAEIDISNWQILDKEEQIKITFPENTKVSAGGFLLLERTDDNSAPNVKADIIYTGALSNSNEALRLFDDKCGLIDEVFASSEWPAGEVSKRTMERQTDLGWWTYNGAGEGSGDTLILGTPKKENMVKVVYYGGGGGGGAATAAVVVETNNNSDTQPLKILISEVQAYPTNNRFIELYNPNDSAIDLTNWYIQRKTQSGDSFGSLVSKTYFDGKTIGAHGYFVVSRNAMDGADIVLDSLTLTESNTIQLKNSVGEVADIVGWGQASDCGGSCATQLLSDQNNQSIQRKFQNNLFINTNNNASDFEIQNCPSPKSLSKTCAVSEASPANGASEPNQAPSAFFDFSPIAPKTDEAIIFNAASSTDPDGNIVLYEWSFGDNQLASSTQATTTHSYLWAGSYKTGLTIFDDVGATSTAETNLTIASSTANSNTGHILISEIMPGMGTGNSDAEFIELYNPTDNPIDLTNYELRRKSSVSATSTQILVKKENFAGKIIAIKGFLLITSPEHPASTTADIIYSQYSSPRRLAYDDDVVILYNASGTIIDEVDYESIGEGKSLERKAVGADGACVSAQGNGEFLGNGCDIEDFSAEGGPASGWEIRNIPAPQNSENFMEPRNAPVKVSNFSAQYDKAKKEINLSWNASQDYLGTTTLTYKITDAGQNPNLSFATTSLLIATTSISQLGRDYIFAIQAIDKEGLSSDTATTTISVPIVSIEDVDYFILNKIETSGTMSLSDRIFKPLATGVIDSMAFNIGVSYNQNIPGTSSDVDINMYEWNGDTQSRGVLVAKSGAITIYSHTSSLTLNFSGENKVVLDSNKYYYFEINTTSSGLNIRWSPYIVIKAVSTGIVEISSPTHNYVYENPNIDFDLKYLEPFENKYSSLVFEVRDFYTEELVSGQTIVLGDNEKTIGWHEISGNLNINRPGYFKLKIYLSDLAKSEINFSVFGAEPPAGKLLNQTAFTDNFSVNSAAQTFRPMVSGKLDSITLKLSTSGNGWNYTSLKIYEWIGGQRNSLEGSKGQLLATSESKMFWSNTAVGEGGDFTWNFSDENKVNLDGNSYYYLETSIDSQSNGGAPNIYFRGSSNDSLIDGKIYSGSVVKDLYIIISAKLNL